MIELNMKFNKKDLFYKEPPYIYVSSAYISMIVYNLLTSLTSDTSSFYCKCHYAGKFYNKRNDLLRLKTEELSYDDLYGKLFFEEKDFSEELSLNFPNHVDNYSLESYFWLE